MPPVIRWSPFDLFSMRRGVDDFLGPLLARESAIASTTDWAPRVDVSESAEEFKVNAEIPGVDESDVRVFLRGGQLVIQGEKRSEEERKEEQLRLVERRYGSFERVIPIPTSVDEERIIAEFHRGVLEIHLPKSAESVPKSIPIQAK